MQHGGDDVEQVADFRTEFRLPSLGMAALFAFFGVSASTVLPLSAQVVTAPTPSQASDLIAPIVAGVRAAGTQTTAVESVISATTISASHGYPAAQASVLQAVVFASETAGNTADAIGIGEGQAFATRAGNPATQRLAVSLAAAAPGVMNTAELAAFKAATTAVTINGQTLGSIVAALGTQALQITAAIPGTAATTMTCAVGALPGTGSAGSDSTGGALLNPSWF
jgi:hypothetical protein